jgi:hypothetical protein
MDLTPYQDVYANLIASGLSSLGGRILSVPASSENGTGRQRPRGWATALRRPLVDLASAPALELDVDEERLRAFLLSAEARDVVTGVAVATLAGSEQLQEAMATRFTATFSWFTGLPEASIAGDAGRLFAAMTSEVGDVVRMLAVEVDDDETALAELVAELSTATAQATAVVRRDAVPDFDAIFVFEERYRAAAMTRFGRIEPPNHEGATIPLEALYVAPRFSVRAETEEQARIVADTTVSGQLHRTVVLGSPGAGKSSFSRALCFRYASAPATAPLEAATPLLVELRDYAAQKERDGGLSIVGFIERVAKSSFQTPPPPGAVEYLLTSGRAIVVFDGLDELTTTHSRRAIRDTVDAFAVLYPFTRILVTSRERGYWEAPLDVRRFTDYRIEEFDEGQVSEYAKKWFSLDAALTPSQQSEKAAGFLRESVPVMDLRSNPLLLALMCAIYKRQNFIPRNRADVYQQCAEMLFERWDQSRGIQFDRPLDSRLHEILQHVAKWIFENQGLQAGVTSRELRDYIAAYFLEDVQVVDSAGEAQALAARFVDFCHGRGWVLVATGSDDNDEELYEFAHRTFLEFFAAGWYASNGSTSQELADVLLPRVAAGEWEMVALLAVQLRNRVVRQSADEILSAMVARAPAEDLRERANLLAFGARCYEFYVPRAAITRAIADLVISTYLESLVDGTFEIEATLQAAATGLLGADDEAHKPVVEGMASVLVAAVEDGLQVGEAVDIALNVRLFRSSEVPENELSQRVGQAVWEAVSETLLVQADHDRSLAIGLVYAHRLPIERCLERWGIDWLFHVRPHPGFHRVHQTSMAEGFLSAFLIPRPYLFTPVRYEEALRAVGEALALAPFPWVTQEELDSFSPVMVSARPSRDFDSMDADLRAYVAVLFAVSLQWTEPDDLERVRSELAVRSDGFARMAEQLLDGEKPDLGVVPERAARLLDRVLASPEAALESLIWQPIPDEEGHPADAGD